VEPQNRINSLNHLAPAAAVGLSDEEIVRLTDQLLLDEELNIHGPPLLSELACTIPVVAEIVEGLTMEAWQTFYHPYREPSKCCYLP